jgi:hypothetical protein
MKWNSLGVFLLRFNRDYNLVIGLDDQAVIVRPPMRIAFDCQKSVSGGLNKLTLKIYNLRESNRMKLVKDREEQTRIPIILSVGYAGNLETIFKGTVEKGENGRTGTDHISTLDCLDGGYDFRNSFTSATVRGKDNAVNTILEDMPNTGRGKITAQNKLVRPKVLVGNSAKLISQQLNEGETWYIDDEKLYILKENEVISSYIPVVSAATGLRNTPQRQNQKVTFDTLMNPSVKIGGKVELQSKTAPHLNGVYKAESMGYKGDNYGAEWSQSITGLKDNGLTVI